MTYAPDDLLAVRDYLIRTLDLVPGVARGQDLEPGEVGIVGDAAHASSGGYHEGYDDLAAAGRLGYDYSVTESSRDRAGLTNAASALDIGEFDATLASGRRVTLRSLSLAVVALCVAGDPRTRDIREVIYTPDGVTVRRWDRLGKRTGGDSSHLWHTHFSLFRDSEGRRAGTDNLLGLFRALIEGGFTMADGINDLSDVALVLADGTSHSGTPTGPTFDHIVKAGNTIARTRAEIAAGFAADQRRDEALAAAFQAIAAGGTSIDTTAVLKAVGDAASAESATVSALAAELHAAGVRIVHLEGALAAAASAEAAALAQPTA